jgi:predicted methyltransferase MtxX (methanogen marker protein 4)
VRRLALLELSGWAFLLGTVGIDEGESMSDRLELLLGGARFLEGMGVVPQAAVLSGGQMEVPGAGCERVDKEPAGRRVDC